MRPDLAQQVFLLSSFLLQYPDYEWRACLPEIAAGLEELDDSTIEECYNRFLQSIYQFDEQEWAEAYVRTFDFGKKTNLYVTYARFGEERERGPALLELKKQYEEAGLELEDEHELPDYLPLMLEFAAFGSQEIVAKVLSDHRPTIERIVHELESIGSPYAVLVHASLLAMDSIGVQ